jgi:hypothetical protein
MKHLLTLLFCWILPLTASAAETWLTDIDEAAQQAAAQNKHILVACLALDQSNSKRFRDQVLQSKDFAPELSGAFVLVLLNLPMDSSQRSKIKRADEYQKFCNRFDISRLTPQILLLTAERSAYARYEADGSPKPAAALAAIAKLRKNQFPKLQQTATALAEWDAAAGETRWLLWDKLAKLYREKVDDPLHLQYEAAVRTGIESDPENARGRKKLALEALLLNRAATPEEIAQAKELDPKNKLGLLELTFYLQCDTTALSISSFESRIEQFEQFAKGGLKHKEKAFEIYFVQGMAGSLAILIYRLGEQPEGTTVHIHEARYHAVAILCLERAKKLSKQPDLTEAVDDFLRAMKQLKPRK